MSNEHNEDALAMGGLFLIIAGTIYKLWPLVIPGCFLFWFAILTELL